MKRTYPAETAPLKGPPAVGAATATSETPLPTPWVAASPSMGVVGDPEFLPADGIRRMFGLSRSSLYRLLHEGRIKAVNLRRRGFASGRRLFSVNSIRDLLHAEMKQQEGSKV